MNMDPNSSASGFERLTVYGFRQFGLVDIDLSSRLTVLTGANGAGKTTLLGILGQHFSWHSTLLAGPKSGRHSADLYSLDVRNLDPQYLDRLAGELSPERLAEFLQLLNRRPGTDYYQGIPQRAVGELKYAHGGVSQLLVPEASYSIQYSLSINPQLGVTGLYLGSHRTASIYQPVTSIPAEFAQADQILAEYINEIRSFFTGGRSEKSSMLRMKEALLAAAVYGEGNSAVRPDPQAEKVWSGFQKVLKLILPESLGFQELRADPPEIVLETSSGQFTIDSISGGMSALFELAWQIHLRSSGSEEFTVCFDEPENHLHPSLQRTLIPSLLEAFPRVKFIVATHSPFIVTASRDARVFVLKYNDERLVDSVELDFDNKAQSAEATLTQVLDLPSTTPVWADDEFDSIMESYLSRPITPEAVRRLKEELISRGLKSSVPLGINRFLGEGDK